MLGRTWHSLIDSLTSSAQGTFLHVCWIVVAVMTILMTSVAVGRIVPSRKARRLRKTVAAQEPLPHVDHDQMSTRSGSNR